MIWRQKWRRWGRDWIGENLGLKVLSVSLAFLLWLTVLGEQKAEVVLNVPLEVGDIPKGMMVVSEPGDYVAVKVRGPKSVVMALVPHEIHLGKALRRLQQGENILTLSSAEVEVPRGVEVLSVSPARLKILVEPVEERRLEVIPKLRGEPAPGFALGKVTVTPPRVKVEGPRIEVRRLLRAYTLPIDIEGRKADVTVDATVEPLGKRVRVIEGESVNVHVEIKKERG
jgi:YbbR domain-containing protein